MNFSLLYNILNVRIHYVADTSIIVITRISIWEYGSFGSIRQGHVCCDPCCLLY